MPAVIAGILEHVREMTLFLNTTENSYRRVGSKKAPRYVSWSNENRSQLIRIPAARGSYKRAELRSPDPLCNPYLAFALMIRAGLDGIKRGLTLPQAADINLYTAPQEVTEKFAVLPESLEAARAAVEKSEFVRTCLPESIIKNYLG